MPPSPPPVPPRPPSSERPRYRHDGLLRRWAYEEQLRAANRWATLAGASRSTWVRLAHGLPTSDPAALRLQPTESARLAPTVDPSSLHRAVQTLNARRVADLLEQGDDPNHRLPRFNGRANPMPVQDVAHDGPTTSRFRTTLSPLDAALGLTDQVWSNADGCYRNVQWQASELDAQAVIVGLLLAFGATVEPSVLGAALGQTNPAVSALVMHPWSGDSPCAPQVQPALPALLASGRLGASCPDLVMEHLLRAGFDLNRPVVGHNLPVVEAIRAGNGNLIAPLLRLGVRLPDDPSARAALLHVAVRRNGQNRAAMEALIRPLAPHGLAVPTDEDAQTLLHTAAANDRLPAIDVLLELGAGLDALDALGRTPLYVAVEQGSTAAVDALLAAGADPRAPTIDRPMLEAARQRLARIRLAGLEADEDGHRVVQRLEALVLNEVLATVGLGEPVPPRDPALTAPATPPMTPPRVARPRL